MQYAVMIYETNQDFAKRTDPSQAQSYWGGYAAYGEALGKAGAAAGGAALQGPETATTVRLRNGERLVQDGPYADTKEQLGGFYLIEAADLDAALEWAARCPGADTGAIEVRPLVPMP